MNEEEWFSGYSVDHTIQIDWDKPSPSLFLDALMAAIMGWALFMCAIATALRAWRRR